MAGFIKLHRKIMQSEIYLMPPLYLRVFERLVMEANHLCARIPYNKTTKLIKRGERLTNVRQIGDWVGWYERGIFKVPNPKTIKTILDWLCEKGMIEIYSQSNRTETHYIVVNYSDYQSIDALEVTEKKRLGNAKCHKTRMNKNDKELYVYGEFVSMTKEEYQKLLEKHGEELTNRMMEVLDNYKGSSGKKYASDYRAILNWVEKRVLEEIKKPATQTKPQPKLQQNKHKSKWHLPESRGEQYTADELENLVLSNQKRKQGG